MQFVIGVQTEPVEQEASPPRVQGGRGVKEMLGVMTGGMLVLAPTVAARAKHEKINSLEGCIVIENSLLNRRKRSTHTRVQGERPCFYIFSTA